jgi:hypothetical protein
MVQASLGKKQDPISNNKRAESLPSKLQALSSVLSVLLSTAKKKKKKKARIQ